MVSDIIKEISKERDIPEDVVRKIIYCQFRTLKKRLKEGDKPVRLKYIGVWKFKKRKDVVHL